MRKFFGAPETGEGLSRLLRWIRIGALLVLAGGAGFLLVVSGIIPLKASSGHWDITAWFLNFSMERSVSTHSAMLEAPELDSPHLVLKGAAHFDSGCAPCHGSPELPSPRIPRAMTPHPPPLSQAVTLWEPEELFYIVKHGVKFTGMPAWPAQERDDEVWSVVAFLLELPRLDAAQYRRLAGRDEEPGEELAGMGGAQEGVPDTVRLSCSRCHGEDGLGRGRGAFPRLAGQSYEYLYASLEAFAQGRRPSGIMEPTMSGLSRAEMGRLALYYAQLGAASPPAAGTGRAAGSAQQRELGRKIASYGLPQQRVPSCVDCHGPGPGPRNAVYPKLAGQYAEYLVLQLKLFQTGRRGGTPYAHLMKWAVEELTPEQMRAVALYYQELPSSEPVATAPRPDARSGPR